MKSHGMKQIAIAVVALMIFCVGGTVNLAYSQNCDDTNSDPVCSDPVCSDPVCSDPVCSDPVCSDPVCSDPVCSDPVCSDPGSACGDTGDSAQSSPSNEPANSESGTGGGLLFPTTGVLLVTEDAQGAQNYYGPLASLLNQYARLEGRSWSMHFISLPRVSIAQRADFLSTALAQIPAYAYSRVVLIIKDRDILKALAPVLPQQPAVAEFCRTLVDAYVLGGDPCGPVTKETLIIPDSFDELYSRQLSAEDYTLLAQSFHSLMYFPSLNEFYLNDPVALAAGEYTGFYPNFPAYKERTKEAAATTETMEAHIASQVRPGLLNEQDKLKKILNTITGDPDAWTKVTESTGTPGDGGDQTNTPTDDDGNAPHGDCNDTTGSCDDSCVACDDSGCNDTGTNGTGNNTCGDCNDTTIACDDGCCATCDDGCSAATCDDGYSATCDDANTPASDTPNCAWNFKFPAILNSMLTLLLGAPTDAYAATIEQCYDAYQTNLGLLLNEDEINQICYRNPSRFSECVKYLADETNYARLNFTADYERCKALSQPCATAGETLVLGNQFFYCAADLSIQPKKETGKTCASSDECLSGLCDAGACQVGVPVNQPPAFEQMTHQVAIVGQPIEFSVTALDPDSASLTYSTIRLPQDATFSEQSFSWLPTTEQTGDNGVIFKVSDGQLADYLPLHIYVYPEGTSQSPPPPAEQSAAMVNPPSDVQARIVPGTSKNIEVTWTDNSPDEQYFRVFRTNNPDGESQQPPDGDWTGRATLDPDTTTYTFSLTSYATTYYFYVRAIKGVDVSIPSNIVSITTGLPTPNITNATGDQIRDTDITETTVTIRWNTVSGADGYLLRRTAVAGGAVQDIYPGKVTSYPDSGLPDGTAYTYALQAYKGEAAAPTAVSDWSTLKNATTKLYKPVNPAAVLDATDDRKVNLSWQYNPASSAAGFIIRRVLEGETAAIEVGRVDVPTVIFSDTTTQEGKAYTYHIVAYKGSVESAYAVTGSGNPPFLSVPVAAPTNFTATAQGATGQPPAVQLSWTNQSLVADKLDLRVSTVPGNFTTPPAGQARQIILTPSAGTQTHLDSGLLTGQTYYYSLQAYKNATAQRSKTIYTDAATSFNLPQPTGLTATASIATSQISIALHWDFILPQGETLVGFKIERSELTDTTGFQLIKNLQVTGVNDWTDNPTNTPVGYPRDGRRYYYRVIAYNVQGNSLPSAPIAILTPLPAPEALTAAAISAQAIGLIWSDHSTNEAEFVVLRAENTDGPYTELPTTAGQNATQFIDSSGLTDGNAYYYKVKARNALTESALTGEAFARTNLSAPVNFQVHDGTSATEIRLTWDNTSTKATGFHIYAEQPEKTPPTMATLTDVLVVAGRTSYETYHRGLLGGDTWHYYVKAFYRPQAAAEVLSDSTPNLTGTTRPALLTPASLTATALVPTTNAQTTAQKIKVQLRWGPGADRLSATGYKVERAFYPQDGNPLAWQLIKTIAGGSLATWIDDSAALVEGTPYIYRIRAYSPSGHSLYSNEASVVTQLYIPQIILPTSRATVKSGVSSEGHPIIYWLPANPRNTTLTRTGYLIERKKENGPYEPAPSSPRPAEANSIPPDTSVIDGSPYTYRVRATNSYTASEWSVEVPLDVPLLQPTSFSVSKTAGSNTFHLSWLAQSNSRGTTKFILERQRFKNTGAALDAKYVPIAELSGSQFSSDDIDLVDGYRNKYRLRAESAYYIFNTTTNAWAPASYASALTYRTFPMPTITYDFKLIAPAGVTAQRVPAAPTRQIQVNWQDNSLNQPVTYTLQYTTDQAFDPKTLKTITYAPGFTAPGNRSYTITHSTTTPVLAGYTYYIRIQSTRTGAFTSDWSNTATIAMEPMCPAPVITAVSIVSDTQLRLEWTDPTNGAAKFEIERIVSGNPTGFNTPAKIDIAPLGTTSYLNSGLLNGTTYEYRMRAYNLVGSLKEYSEYSNIYAKTTRLAKPGVPSVKWDAATHTMKLTWTQTCNNESGFLIQRKIGATGTYEDLINVDANTVKYDDYVTDCPTYYYRIKAFSAGLPEIESPWAESVGSAATIAAAITTPTCVASGSPRQVTLRWKDMTNSESGFKIFRKAGTQPYSQLLPDKSPNDSPNAEYVDASDLIDGTSYTYQVVAYSSLKTPTNYTAVTFPLIAVPLSQPTNFTVSESPARVDLNWQNQSLNAPTFVVEYSEINTFNPLTATVTVPTAGAQSHTINNSTTTKLLGGKTYYFRIKSTKSGSTASPTVNYIAAGGLNPTPVTMPFAINPPANPLAQGISETQMKLSWDPLAVLTDVIYEIERSDAPDGPFVRKTLTVSTETGTGKKIATDGASPALLAGKIYYYRIRANSPTKGYSEYTEPFDGRVLLAKPTGLLVADVVNTRGQVRVSWTNPSANGGTTKFRVERKLGATGTYQPVEELAGGIVAAQVGVNIFIDTEVLDNYPANSYYYRVAALDDTEHPSLSVESAAFSALFTKPSGTATGGLPTATAGDPVSAPRTITLNWIPTAFGEDGIRVERLEGTVVKRSVTLPAGSGSFIDSDADSPTLVDGKNYTYKITAYKGTYNATAQITFVLLTAKATGVTAVAEAGKKARISWVNNSTNNPLTCNVYRATNPLGTWTKVTATAISATANGASYEFLNTGLVAATQYYYKVRTDKAGIGITDSQMVGPITAMN